MPARKQKVNFDPGAIVRTLNTHCVRFVIIGGVAAQIRDLPVPATVDIDITPARDKRNLERLAAAFDELSAGLLTADETGTWFPRLPTENWARYDTLHLMTKHGPLDIVFVPDGAETGYPALAKRATSESFEDQHVDVITVATWVTLKEATGRAKDLEHLDRYYASRPRGDEQT